METKTYRSPFAPPLIPASPSEAIRIRVLSSIPEGTLIIKLFCFEILPIVEFGSSDHRTGYQIQLGQTSAYQTEVLGLRH